MLLKNSKMLCIVNDIGAGEKKTAVQYKNMKHEKTLTA